MEINVNVTLSASPALLAALAALVGAAAQTAPAAQPEPVKPARKQTVKNEPKPAPAQVEDKKEEPDVKEQPKEEPSTISYETFSKTIIPINQVVGPDKMRELIAEFGGKGTLRTIPEDRRQEFIDRAKAMAEGGAA